MDPKISVVVPVYKVEKFIAECLKSILSQDFDAFEVIAVDDGSPDSSGAICDDFARRDPRLTVIHKENGGVAAARKTGVEHARGEWITLVDNDDVLLPHALAALYAASQQFPDADIVEGSPVRFCESSELKAFAAHRGNAAPRDPVAVNSGLDYAKEVAAQRLFRWTPWAKLLRREALLSTNAFDIPAGTICEDNFMDFRAATKARRAVRIFTDVYGWRKRATSQSKDKKYHELDTWLKVWTQMRRAVADQPAEWLDVWKIYTANTLFDRFSDVPAGVFFKNPQVRAYLAELAPARAAMPPGIRRKLNLLLLGTKFPFSVLPKSLFRATIDIPRRARTALITRRLRKNGDA